MRRRWVVVAVVLLGCGPGEIATGFGDEVSDTSDEGPSVPPDPSDEGDPGETDTGEPEPPPPDPLPPPVPGVEHFDIEYDGDDVLTLVRTSPEGLELNRLIAGEWVPVDLMGFEDWSSGPMGHPAATRDALGQVHALTVHEQDGVLVPTIWQNIGASPGQLWVVGGGLTPTSLDVSALLAADGGFHSLQQRSSGPFPTWLDDVGNLAVQGSSAEWFAVAGQLERTALDETIMLAVHPATQNLTLRLFVGTEHVHTKILGGVPLPPPLAGPAASFNADLVVHWYGAAEGELRDAWLAEPEQWTQELIEPVDSLVEVVALTRPDGEPTIAWSDDVGDGAYRLRVAERRDGTWKSLASYVRSGTPGPIALALSPTERVAFCDLQQGGELHCVEID